MKTPLSTVKENAELLKYTELTEDQEIYTNFIIKNSNRISDYTSALMMVNKSRKFDGLNLEEENVSNVVGRIRELAKEITSTHGFRLIEVINFEEGKIIVDIKMLERAMQNIFTNAIDYSKDKSIVELNIFSRDLVFNINVLDKGQGFSKEDLIYGSDLFYRGDKSRHSSTNYGLGLFSTRKIINQHGGRLLLNNREDKSGAVVSVELPIVSQGYRR